MGYSSVEALCACRKATPAGGGLGDQAREEGLGGRARDRGRPDHRQRLSGASPGAKILNATAIMNRLPRGRTYVRNGSVSTSRSPQGEIAAHGQRLGSYTVKITVAPPPGAMEGTVRGLRRHRSTPLSNCCRGAFPRASWSASAFPETGLFPSPKTSSCRAAAQTGQTCASMWLLCFMASGRGSTRAPNCCSSCGAWITRS